MPISTDYDAEQRTLRCDMCDGVFNMEEWEIIQDAQVRLLPTWADDHFQLDFEADNVNLLDNIEIGCPECYEYSEISHKLYSQAFTSLAERKEEEEFIQRIRTRFNKEKK